MVLGVRDSGMHGSVMICDRWRMQGKRCMVET